MRTENEHDESSIMKSSVTKVLNDDKRHLEISLMKNEKEDDSSVDLESLEYIMNQTKRTKRFNAYKNHMINALNHLNTKIEYYDILYLRKYESFMSN